MLWFCVVELVMWVFSLKDFSLLEALQAACGYICVLLCEYLCMFRESKVVWSVGRKVRVESREVWCVVPDTISLLSYRPLPCFKSFLMLAGKLTSRIRPSPRKIRWL